jgi:hypothetical protein
MPLSIKELLAEGESEKKKKIRQFLDTTKFDGYYTQAEMMSEVPCGRCSLSEFAGTAEGAKYRIIHNGKGYWARPSIIARDFPERKSK